MDPAIARIEREAAAAHARDLRDRLAATKQKFDGGKATPEEITERLARMGMHQDSGAGTFRPVGPTTPVPPVEKQTHDSVQAAACRELSDEQETRTRCGRKPAHRCPAPEPCGAGYLAGAGRLEPGLGYRRQRNSDGRGREVTDPCEDAGCECCSSARRAVDALVDVVLKQQNELAELRAQLRVLVQPPPPCPLDRGQR